MTNYTLEWKWFEKDNDTEIGINGVNYNINLTVTAGEKV